MMRRPRINGRRGAFQIVFGVVYLIVGTSAFFVPSPGRAALFAWLTPYVSMSHLAVLWIVAAVTALVCAFLPRPRDAAGFVALVLVPGAWFALYVISAGVVGNPLAVLQGVVYALFGSSALIVAGMQGPRDRDTRQVVR